MIEAALAFLAGLLVGSFLNVCIHRMPRDLSVVRPGSQCPACGHAIAWYDNVPVASYLRLGGRCRHCRALISPRYPAVELLTAVLAALAVVLWGPTLPAARNAVFAAMLVALIFTDLETLILPDEFTLGGTALGLASAWFVPSGGGLFSLLWGVSEPRRASLIESAVAAAVASSSLWFVGILYKATRKREGLGLGDVKMVAMIGAFLGLSRALMAVFLGCLAGAVAGLLYIYFARKDYGTYELPFGSFLGAAAILVCYSDMGVVSG